MARVAWRSGWTGATGHGSPLPIWLAVVWRDYANRVHPDFDHWIEPA